MKKAITAVEISVIQKALQTPFAPKALLSKNAAGKMITAYLQSEIASEATPFPSASSAPLAATLTDEATNPIAIIRSA